ncbi:FAD/NAD(P)-binding protein [Rhizobium sp. 768_B6_N1_8]
MHFDPKPGHSVIIIGGGFAGALTALKLLDQTTVALSITIIEPRAELGRGVAYSTSDPAHLVNGPAEIFSLYPEDMGHLARWLTEHGPANGWQPPADVAASSPPRHLYGTYVRYELKRAVAQARSGSSLQHVRSSAAHLSSSPHRVRVATTDGTVL